MAQKLWVWRCWAYKNNQLQQIPFISQESTNICYPDPLRHSMIKSLNCLAIWFFFRNDRLLKIWLQSVCLWLRPIILKYEINIPFAFCSRESIATRLLKAITCYTALWWKTRNNNRNGIRLRNWKIAFWNNSGLMKRKNKKLKRKKKMSKKMKLEKRKLKNQRKK